MVNREQRRKLESEWSQEDQSLLATARIVKGSVLGLLVLGLLFLAGGPGSSDNASQAAMAAAQAPGKAAQGSAVAASRQVYDERRANWQRQPETTQTTASR